MSSINFTGECWISDAKELPALDGGHFGAGWSHIGHIAQDQHEFWKQIKNSSRRGVGFYISILQEDLTELPQRFWLGVEWLTEHLYVATGPAVPRPLAQRPPEVHPGLRQRPLRRLSAHVTADKDRPLFEPIR